MQPNYSAFNYKIRAREENIAAYRDLTGTTSIPSSRGYWTLCNVQEPSSRSEISQVVASGLASKGQFFGVDIDGDVIAKNRKWHPEAHWYVGEWLHVIDGLEEFRPGMIYLDTTSFVDHSMSIGLTWRTMLRCPAGTVLLVNAMLNDPRSSREFDPDILIDGVCRNVPASELVKWDSKVPNYSYSTTGKTEMGTFVFHKM